MRSPLVWIDHDYDRKCAGRNGSRYRSYLEARASRFEDATGCEHAALAWEVATSPVMSPGYVRVRPDLEHVRLDYDADGHLVVRIGVRLRHSVLPGGMRAASDVDVLADWRSERYWNDHAEQLVYGYEQPCGDSLMVSAELVRRLETADFVVPRDDRLDYSLAVRTTGLIAEQIERLAGPVVTALRDVG